MQESNGYYDKVLDTLHDGERMYYKLDRVNEKSWRVCVSRRNRKDGWKHYQVTVNRLLNLLVVRCNGKD